MTIDLEQETETRLIQMATEAGRRPEEFAADMLRSTMAIAKAGLDEKERYAKDGWLRDEYTDGNGWLRNHDGTLLGFDGLTWRQLAHLDHKY